MSRKRKGASMKDVPLGELLKLQEKIGLREFQQALVKCSTSADKSGAENETVGKTNNNVEKIIRRKSTTDVEVKTKSMKKRRPMEISSKRRSASSALDEQLEKKRGFDPRFDPHCGDFDAYIYGQNYAFVTDMKRREKETLKKELKETDDEEKAEKIHHLLRREENRERAEKLEKKKREQIRQLRKVNLERLKQGKEPFYVKKSELKRQQLEEQYKELKKSRKLDKYLDRKAKKVLSKHDY